MFNVIEVSKCKKQFRSVAVKGTETEAILFVSNQVLEYPGLKGRLMVVPRQVDMVVEMQVGGQIVRLERSGSQPPSAEKAEIMAKRQAVVQKREQAYQRLLAQAGPRAKKQK